MSPLFYIKIKIGKFIANIFSGVFRNKDKRHRIRERLNPLNPERCVLYLKKHVVNEPAADLYQDDGKEMEYIWVCWFQGMGNAPKLVQNCIQSIKRYNEHSQIVLITADNFMNYVDISHVIINKWKCGIIDNTHFSDIIRVHLLARHGGVWIDSTCLMLATIPKEILCSDFFIFHSHGEFAFTLVQSCFIRCRKNNYIMRKWVAAIDRYWEQENLRIHYFLLHLTFIALLQTDEKFMKEFNNIPVMNDEGMHFILKKMMHGDKFSDDLINDARKKCFIQKLTYKFPSSLLDDKNAIASVLSK